MKQAAVSADGTVPAVTLRHGYSNNFLQFKEAMGKNLSIKYAKIASVIKTGVAYAIPAITPAQWNFNLNGDLNAAAMTTIRLGLTMEFNKQTARLQETMYNSMISSISPESLETIHAHADFEAAELAESPNLLWLEDFPD